MGFWNWISHWGQKLCPSCEQWRPNGWYDPDTNPSALDWYTYFVCFRCRHYSGPRKKPATPQKPK